MLIVPGEAWAWGPTTHAWIGTRILSDLAVFPPVVRDLLATHAYSYLYGSLSADITLAKRYVHYSRHCHNWGVAYEILDRAETPPLQSFALGYLSHLAADTIAHNVFVPRRLVATPLSSNLGHTYWEYRYDSALDDRYLRMAREIVTRDHEEEDDLLEDVLTRTLFSFQTNKRIYQRLIHLSNDERWKNLWERMADSSKWELPDARVERYGALAHAYVADFLQRGARSLSQRLDPTGHERLAVAKKIRYRSFREARRDAGREVVTAPIMATRSGDTGRMLAARPVEGDALQVLAEVYFPEPPHPSPSRDGADPLWTNGHLPALGSRDPRAFWDTFTKGRALPAGS